MEAVTADAIGSEAPTVRRVPRHGDARGFATTLIPRRQASYTDEDRRRTTARAYDAGLLHVTWPIEYGGRGLPTEYQTVFNEEIRFLTRGR